MKIGIGTFHNAHNYGAILQTVALKTFIAKLGHDCFVIDHKNRIIEEGYRPSYKSLFKDFDRKPWTFYKIVPRFILFISLKKRYKMFERSIARLYNAKPLSELNPDLIVFGSDQIWNEYLIGDDMFYYGVIEDIRKVKKISYAASLGFGPIDFLKKNKSLLEEFQHLGVREKSLQDELKKIGLSSTLTIDPTLLLSVKDWNEIFQLDMVNIVKDYILVYGMRKRKEVLKIAKKISKETGLRILEVRSNSNLNLHSTFSPNFYTSVRGFLKKIKEAKVIITDSFHGTVFSIIFGKPFYSIKYGETGDDRAVNLLQEFNLENHFITPGDSIPPFPPEPERNLLDKYNPYINQSFQYLVDCLSSIN